MGKSEIHKKNIPKSPAAVLQFSNLDLLPVLRRGAWPPHRQTVYYSSPPSQSSLSNLDRKMPIKVDEKKWFVGFLVRPIFCFGSSRCPWASVASAAKDEDIVIHR